MQGEYSPMSSLKFFDLSVAPTTRAEAIIDSAVWAFSSRSTQRNLYSTPNTRTTIRVNGSGDTRICFRQTLPA
jgi:hypothetical protein